MSFEPKAKPKPEEKLEQIQVDIPPFPQSVTPKIQIAKPEPKPKPKILGIRDMTFDQAIADTLFATAAAWGKTPVHAKSTPGFIVNRVARPYYAEGLRLLQEGAADCATIDAVMREAGGVDVILDMVGNPC